MKKLLYCQTVLLAALTACTTLGQRDGAYYRNSALTNMNAAPGILTPPDYTQGTPPLLDSTYMGSQADYHFTMGETLSFEGQSSRAVEEFKTTLIYDPKSIHVRLRLAAEYVRMGMITEAVEQTEIAVEMDPNNIDARMMLGGLHSGLKMFAPARTQFEAILNIQPGHPEASIYLGALLAEERKYEESIKYFDALTRNTAFKDTEKAYYYIGRVRSEQGEGYLDQAERAFTKALALKPEYPEAALALAMLLRARAKEKEMEKLLRSYQDKFGPEREMARQLSHYYLEREDFANALGQLEILDGFERDNVNIKMQIALILIEQKSFEAAAIRLEDVLHLAPESDKVRYYLGAVYEELKRPDLAILHYSKIPAGSSYFSQVTIQSAHLHKERGHLNKAVEVLEDALKQEKDIPQLYAYYAVLLDEQKKYRKGLEMLTAAVERFPDNTQLRFFLGTMHDRLGNSTETVAQMSKVLEKDNDHVQALNYLAYTYAELGTRLEEAETLANRALKIQPNDAYILDTIGWIHFKRGEMETAIKYLEAAFRLKPDESIIAEHLGDAYLRHQMWQKAQKMYNRAVQLEGDDGRHQKIREKLANIKAQVQPPSRAPASSRAPKAQ
ncbi:MAG: tetratricopeptide repeat protein [Bdellovibrionales bacterium]